MKIKFYILALLICLNNFAQNTTLKSFFPMKNSETNSWYFIDKNGNKTIDITEKNIAIVRPLFSNRAVAKDSLKNKWGFLNENGKWAIPPIYDYVNDFNGNFTVVSEFCTTDCNKEQEGLLSPYNSKAIDVNGKVYFKDNAQDERAYARRILFKHVANGVFLYNSGIGVTDLKYYVNINGEVISDRINLYDNPFPQIYFCKELNAYFCKDKYIDKTGKTVLDLSKYQYISLFTNGYAWGNTYDEKTEISTKILINTKGVVVYSNTNENLNLFSDVKNGTFTFQNENNETFSYNISSKTTTKVAQTESIDFNSDDYVWIESEKVYLITQTNEQTGDELVTGFKNEKGEVFMSQE